MSSATLSSGARLPLSKALRKLLQPLVNHSQQSHLPAYLVGGCVRDLLLKREPLDVDVVVEGPADRFARAMAKIYKAKLISHPSFLTHTLVLPKGRHLDIATARTESYSEPAALPTVEQASLQEDLYRRDFSINAMALSLNASDFGHVWDPFGGMEDLEKGLIRVLHGESFKDDPTRLFRAARFAGRFGYAVDWKSREWMTECITGQLPAKLSGARMREELIPILMEKDPRPALRLLSDWGALTFLAPGLQWEKSHDSLFGLAIKLGRGDEILTLRLLALCHRLPFAKAAGSLSHMMIPQTQVVAIEQALKIICAARDGQITPKMMTAFKKPLSAGIKGLLDKALRSKNGDYAVKSEEDWRRYHHSAPCLSGQDLRDMGYKPGPVFKQIFDAIREARWDGKLRTREEEIRFTRHAFPNGQLA